MPKGPNGLPRLTDVGPLVVEAKDLEREDIKLEIEREHYNRIKSKFLEYGSIADDFHDIGANKGGEIVKISMKYQEYDTILGDTDFFTYTGAKVTYAISDVGYIHKIKVNDDLKRLGIGTELMEMALDDMRSEGVDTVYTQAISEAGDKLTEKFGFRIHDELNTLNPRDEWKVKDI